MTEAAEDRVFARKGSGEPVITSLPLILDKLAAPTLPDLVERPRVRRLLAKAATGFPAVLLSGRAETGKTYAAVELARLYDNVAWYTIGPADSDWRVFSSYLTAAIEGASFNNRPRASVKNTRETISKFLDNLIERSVRALDGKEMLVILDDLHHVFDAPWFSDLFDLLLHSVPPNIHLLLLCRSKPPLPLWRLRSKQVLNVIDEKVLAFDNAETARLCKKLGCRASLAGRVPESAAGRAGKVADFLRSTA